VVFGLYKKSHGFAVTFFMIKKEMPQQVRHEN